MLIPSTHFSTDVLLLSIQEVLNPKFLLKSCVYKKYHIWRIIVPLYSSLTGLDSQPACTEGSGMIIYNDFRREHEQFTYQSSYHRNAYWKIKPPLSLESWNFFRDRITIFKTHKPFDRMQDSVKPEGNTYKLRAEGSHKWL